MPSGCVSCFAMFLSILVLLCSDWGGASAEGAGTPDQAAQVHLQPLPDHPHHGPGPFARRGDCRHALLLPHGTGAQTKDTPRGMCRVARVGPCSVDGRNTSSCFASFVECANQNLSTRAPARLNLVSMAVTHRPSYDSGAGLIHFCPQRLMFQAGNHNRS